jgi:zinc protease
LTRRSDHIRRHQKAAVDVQVLPWQIDSVVSLQGSWSVPVSYAEKAGLELDILAALLDKGTTKRDKQSLSALLESVGASISFSSGFGKVHVSARCLAPDVPMVLDLIREQIERPALPERELALLKGRMKAQFRRQRSDPGAVCRNEMSRVLFGPDHPSRELSFEATEALVDALDRDEVVALHGSSESWKGLRLAVVGDVGDIDPSTLSSALVLHEGTEDVFRPTGSRFLALMDPEERHVPIPDRVNLNVQFAHPVDLNVLDDDWLPLWVGVFILGGNFSSRLMSVVRDQHGLTYGIRSALGYAGRHYPGAWTTSVTLSQDRLAEGIAVTREVMNRFVEHGVEEAELQERIETLCGSYEVELSTTAAVASRMLQNISRGRNPEHLDDHPTSVRSVRVEAVNAAIERHLHASSLSLVSAGTRLPE